jgi:hypothetical protein
MHNFSSKRTALMLAFAVSAATGCGGGGAGQTSRYAQRATGPNFGLKSC